MPALHLVFSETALAACMARKGAEDKLLLLGDGVYSTRNYPDLSCLSDDAKTRGITSADAIAYEDFIELCAQYQPIVSWHEP